MNRAFTAGEWLTALVVALAIVVQAVAIFRGNWLVAGACALLAVAFVLQLRASLQRPKGKGL